MNNQEQASIPYSWKGAVRTVNIILFAVVSKSDNLKNLKILNLAIQILRNRQETNLSAADF